MRMSIRGLVLLVSLGLVLTSEAQQPPKGKTDPKAKGDPKAKVDPKAPPKNEFQGKVANIRLGPPVLGPKLTADDLKNRVVLLDLWGVNCPPCLQAMPRTAALNSELREFGLVIIGSHVQDGVTPERVAQVAKDHGANFPISTGSFLTTIVGQITLPRCYLFDHKGDGLFEGHPKDVEPLIRAAVGKMLVEQAGIEKFSPSLQPMVKDLLAGKSPLPIVPRVYSLTTASGTTGTEAKALYDSLTALGQKRLKEADELTSTDPVGAFVMLETMPTQWKGTALATKANEALGKLKRDKAVFNELNARPMLEAIKKLEAPLAGTVNDKNDPNSMEYQKKFATQLKPLKAKIQQLKMLYPDALATKQALEIASRYGLSVN